MKTTLVCVFAIAVAACGDLPEPSIPSGSSQNQTTTPSTQKAIPDPPTVSLATSTTRSTVAVSGRTEAASGGQYLNVTVEGGASLRTTTPADQFGNFCVTIPLNVGQNTLEITAQRPNGATSDATVKRITYNAATTEEEAAQTATVRAASTVDAALHKVPGSSVAGDNMQLMTDDDDTTATTFNDYPSLYFDLGAQWQISDIEIVFPGQDGTDNQSYAEGYDLFVSTVASPTRPVDSETEGWSMIESVSGASGGNGDGLVDSFSYGTPITARWVAMNVTDNDIWYSWRVEIASFRVYGVKVSTGGTGGGSTGDNTIESCQ
jgi:hypothetical protein